MRVFGKPKKSKATGVEPVLGDDLTREKALFESFCQILGPYWDHLKPCDDKRLEFVIARWQVLPEQIRNAIRTLAEMS